METITVHCRGMRPLVMNQMAPHAWRSFLAGREPTKRSPQQRIDDQVYRDDAGRIGLPSDHLIGILRSVWVDRKAEHLHASGITTQHGAEDSSFLIVEEEFLPFVNIPKDAEHPWTIFSRKMTPVFTSGPSVAALHPKFDTWEFAVTITYDSKRIPKTKVLDIIREAGRSEGLGAYRIDGFGRFGVTK